MTTTRERFVIVKRRKTKRGVFREVHVYRPERGYERTLDGVDPAAPGYMRSLIRAQDDYARFCSAGRPKAPLRNAKGSMVDEHGMALTRPPGSPAYQRRFGRLAPIDETTVAWLAQQFLVSAQVRSLKPVTRARADDALRRFCGVTWPKPEAPDAVVGDAAFASVRKEHMLKIRARFADTPAQADYIVKTVRAMFYWGEEVGIVHTVNPAARMGGIWQSDGHEPWTYDEHHKFCARWPIGTTQRLAYDLALYSGARVCDLHMLGPQHLRRGWLHWVEEKGKDSTALKRRAKKNKVREWIARAELLASIAATTHGIRNFIVRPDGQPYAKPDRLGRAMVRWATAAGVGKTAHGIRKLGATMLADNNADLIEIRDFLGHTSFHEAEIYIRNRDKRRVSVRAVALMDIDRAANATA